jgi:hypothetical protein
VNCFQKQFLDFRCSKMNYAGFKLCNSLRIKMLHIGKTVSVDINRISFHCPSCKSSIYNSSLSTIRGVIIMNLLFVQN